MQAYLLSRAGKHPAQHAGGKSLLQPRRCGASLLQHHKTRIALVLPIRFQLTGHAVSCSEGVIAYACTLCPLSTELDNTCKLLKQEHTGQKLGGLQRAQALQGQGGYEEVHAQLAHAAWAQGGLFGSTGDVRSRSEGMWGPSQQPRAHQHERTVLEGIRTLHQRHEPDDRWLLRGQLHDR